MVIPKGYEGGDPSGQPRRPCCRRYKDRLGGDGEWNLDQPAAVGTTGAFAEPLRPGGDIPHTVGAVELDFVNVQGTWRERLRCPSTSIRTLSPLLKDQPASTMPISVKPLGASEKLYRQSCPSVLLVAVMAQDRLLLLVFRT